MSVTSDVDRITGAVTNRQSGVLRLFIAGACFVIIVAGLKIAAPIVSVVLLGLLVAQSLSNVPMWLMKKGLKPGTSVLLSILFVLVGGLLLVTFFSISTESGWQSAVIVIVGWWFVNLIGDNVIKPRFFVKGLDISFTNIVFSVVFWSFVLGPAGAILALPIALSLRRLATLIPGSMSA